VKRQYHNSKMKDKINSMMMLQKMQLLGKIN